MAKSLLALAAAAAFVLGGGGDAPPKLADRANKAQTRGHDSPPHTPTYTVSDEEAEQNKIRAHRETVDRSSATIIRVTESLRDLAKFSGNYIIVSGFGEAINLLTSKGDDTKMLVLAALATDEEKELLNQATQAGRKHTESYRLMKGIKTGKLVAQAGPQAGEK